MTKNSWFSDYNIAVFTLVFMSIQLLFIEGWAVSIPKVVFMAITPALLLIKSPCISKATIFGGAFIIVTLGMACLHPNENRSSTFYYTALFLCTFNLYYNLVYINNVFKIDDFIKIIKGVIYAYAICLLLQQLCMLVGINYLPIINLMRQPYYELFRLNTLAIEPSHAARLMTIYFYAFLKVNEYKYGRGLSLKELFATHKWIVIAFLYTVIGIGSATSFVGLGILALYFLKKQYAVYVVVFGFTFYMIVPMIDYEPLNRTMAVFNAAMTADTEVVKETDNSAAARVNILLDTFKYLDLEDADTWIGNGTDSSLKSGKAIVSAISDYGMFSYLSKLVFFFVCCFTSFFSLEVLIFILLFSLNIGNIAYGFAALMVFSTIKYFRNKEN